MLSSQRTEFIGAELLDVAPARIKYEYCRIVGFEYRGTIDDKADASTLLSSRQQQMEAIIAYCPEGGGETVIQSVQIDLDNNKVGSRQHLLTLTGYRNITHATLSAHGSNEEVILCYTEIVGGRTSFGKDATTSTSSSVGHMSNVPSSSNLANMLNNNGSIGSSSGPSSHALPLTSSGGSNNFEFSTNSESHILGDNHGINGVGAGAGVGSNQASASNRSTACHTTTAAAGGHHNHPTFRITLHVVGTNLAKDITPIPNQELSNHLKGYRSTNICPRAYFLRQTKPRSQLYMLVSYDYVSLTVYKVGFKGGRGFEFEVGGGGALAGRHLWHHWCPLTQRVSFWVYRNTYELRVMKISSSGGASASIFQMADSRRGKIDPIPFSPPPNPCLPWGSGNSSLNANFSISMVPIAYETSGEKPMIDLAMCYQKLVSVLGRGGGNNAHSSFAHTAHSGSHKVSIHCSILLLHNWLHSISLVFDIDISHVPVTACLRASFVFLDGLIAIIIPGVFVHFVDVAHHDQPPRYMFGLDLLAFRHAERDREMKEARAIAAAAAYAHAHGQSRGSSVMGDIGRFSNAGPTSSAVPLNNGLGYYYGGARRSARGSISGAGGSSGRGLPRATDSSGSHQSLSSSAAASPSPTVGTLIVGSVHSTGTTPTSPASPVQGLSETEKQTTTSVSGTGVGLGAQSEGGPFSIANAKVIHANSSGYYSAANTSPLTPQQGHSQHQQHSTHNNSILSFVASVFGEFSSQAHPAIPHRTGSWIVSTDSTRLYRITLNKNNLWRWIRDGTGGVERFGIHNAIHVASTHFGGKCSSWHGAGQQPGSGGGGDVILCGEGCRYHSIPMAEPERFGIKTVAELLEDRHTAVTPSFLCQVLIGEAYSDVRRACRAKNIPYWPHVPMSDDHGLAELEEIKVNNRSVSAVSECPNRSWVRDTCKRTDENWWLAGEDLRKSTFFGLVKKKTLGTMHRFSLTGGIVRTTANHSYHDSIRRILLGLDVPRESADFISTTYTKSLESLVKAMLSIDDRSTITPVKKLHFLHNMKIALLALDFPAPESFDKLFTELSIQLMPPSAVFECVRGKLITPNIKALFKHYECLQGKVNDAARDTGFASQHLPIMSIGNDSYTTAGNSVVTSNTLTHGNGALYGGGGALHAAGETAIPPTDKEMSYALEGLSELCPQLISADDFAMDVTSSAAVSSSGLTPDEKHALIAAVQPEPVLQSYRRHFPLDANFGKYLPLNLFVNSPMARESRLVATNEAELHVKRERAQLVMLEALYPMVIQKNKTNPSKAVSPHFRL